MPSACPVQGGRRNPYQLLTSYDVYHICLIRCRGYYLFHRTILCGFYSRVATNQERRLLNSNFPVKSFIIVRALRKTSFTRFTKNCDAVTWFWSKPSSLISRHFATKWYLHGTSNAFPRNDFTRWSPSVPQKWWTPLDSLRSCTYRLFCSARPEVWWHFESSVWLSKYESSVVHGYKY